MLPPKLTDVAVHDDCVEIGITLNQPEPWLNCSKPLKYSTRTPAQVDRARHVRHASVSRLYSRHSPLLSPFQALTTVIAGNPDGISNSKSAVFAL